MLLGFFSQFGKRSFYCAATSKGAYVDSDENGGALLLYQKGDSLAEHVVYCAVSPYFVLNLVMLSLSSYLIEQHDSSRITMPLAYTELS